MPQGKNAGVRCVQLTKYHLCGLYGKHDRPAVCHGLQPSLEMCGRTVREAYENLDRLERMTRTK